MRRHGHLAKRNGNLHRQAKAQSPLMEKSAALAPKFLLALHQQPHKTVGFRRCFASDNFRPLHPTTTMDAAAADSQLGSVLQKIQEQMGRPSGSRGDLLGISTMIKKRKKKIEKKENN
jgi:hypothetical protein